MLLTDDELMKLAQVPPEDYSAPPYWWLRANQRVAKAQLEAIVEWGNEYCTSHPYRSKSKGEEYNRQRYRCPDCWQAIVDEVKE